MAPRNHPDLVGILQFLHLSNNLKKVLRSHNVCENRKESVSDHSWKLALMLIAITPHLDRKIDLERALIMAIIHDLGECLVGDTNLLDMLNNENLAKEKSWGICFFSKSTGSLKK